MPYVDIDTGHSLGRKIKLHEMKNEKNYMVMHVHGFSYDKNMANFEAFL